ncbi:MAG: Fic family protein [Candidatus Omnitrophota bacterium]
MKIPEKAPNWYDNIQDLLNRDNFNKLNEFVVEVEQRDEYVYWDKIKYLRMPEGITPKIVWSYVKFSRQSKIKKIPLISKDNQQFGYWMPNVFLKHISYVDKHASGEILVGDTTIHKSEQKKHLVNSLMEEAIASSLLEGAATTRKKAKEMLRSGRKPKSNAEQMIFNNYKTILMIKNLIKENLDNNLVLKLHRSMTIDTLDNPDECGRFRIVEDGPIYVKDNEGQVLHEPPSPDMIPKMMNLLYDYANKIDEKEFTHPIIKAINLHFFLSYIHPFMDGNGRTARALFYWYMLKHGYWMFEYLTISRIFLSAPSRYARAFLYTEIDDLDLTYFLSFHLDVISEAIKKLIEHIKNKQKEAGEVAQYLRKFPNFNERQKALLADALENRDRLYTVAYHGSVHNVTYEAARRDLMALYKKGFFVKGKRGRAFTFVSSERLIKKMKKI